MENFNRLKNEYEEKIIPCSALAEYFLRTYHQEKKIEYIPGSNSFRILNNNRFNQNELKGLINIQEKIIKNIKKWLEEEIPDFEENYSNFRK